MKEVEKKKEKRSEKLSVKNFKSTEARENFLIGLAYELAERKLRDGTASSQIITTLLQMHSEKAKLENQKLKSDLDVANAKIANMRSQEASEEIAEKALAAFRRYSGQMEEDEEFDEEDIF